MRISDRNGIRDFDLRAECAPISAGNVLFTPEGEGWRYYAAAPVPVNGTLSSQGAVALGDVYLIDRNTQTKAMVLPKVFGPHRELSFEGELTVGRSGDNRLELRDFTVSGHHCVFSLQNGVLYIQDRNSTNGTFLNGKSLPPGSFVQLKAHDEVKVGRYTFLAGPVLRLHRGDDGAVFHAVEKSSGSPPPRREAGSGTGYAVPRKPPYPQFSPAPRMYASLPPLSVRIEEAPSIGEKPSMGMMAIATSPTAMAISASMMALRYGLGKRKYTQKEEKRAEIYTRYLAGLEEQLQNHAKRQRELALQRHPAVVDCLKRVQGPALNLWERHPGDEDFLSLRLGLGRAPAAAQISLPATRLQINEDEFSTIPGQIAEKYAQIDGMPICCELMRDGVCGIVGSRQEAVQLAQNMAVQIAALHSYEEVKLVVVFPRSEWEQWSWMRWLPHCTSPDRDLRYIACTPDGMRELLPSLEEMVKSRTASASEWSFGARGTNLPHYIFLVADPSLLAGSPTIGTAMVLNQPELGLSGVILGQSLADFPHSTRNIIRVSSSGDGLRLSLQRDGATTDLTSAESKIPRNVYEVFARRMAPIRLAGSETQGQAGLPSMVTFFEGLRVRKVEDLALDEFWGTARPEETMSVPIGVRSGGELFFFNIHENAQGPHGLVAGGTGSGKSKMVQAWVASMAVQFSPEDVNFILVDFKGESLLTPFKGLPHLAGFTSNIDPDVRRKFMAIESEMTRRMVLLKTGGKQKFDDIIAYRRARRTHPEMEPMPFLVLVVDEFAAFKDQYPEFIGAIDHLFQAGRSLGMLAILMTQKPSGKVTAQMQANLGFSWCLRVSEDADSREVIGNSDAAHLRGAGRAYVKAVDGTYELIQTLYGLAPYEPEQEQSQANAQVFALKLNGAVLEGSGIEEEVRQSRPDELTVLTRHIADHCRKKHIPAAQPIWRDPLPEKLDLNTLTCRPAEEKGGLRAALGLVDDPAHQLQETLEHDFWTEGNLAIYGVPQSGRSTLLQTLLVSLFRAYAPDRLHCYILECGTLSLRALERFPQVGGAAGDDEPDTVNKIIAFLLEELERRKRAFRRAGVSSPEGYAQLNGTSPISILLAIHNLNRLGDGFSDLQSKLVKLSGEGPSYGMYLACTFYGSTGIWVSRLRQNLKRSIALQLPNKMDYTDLTGRVSQDTDGLPAGRGFVKMRGTAVQLQAAIAYGEHPDGQRSALLCREADAMGDAWLGERPISIQPMPEEIPYGMLQGPPLVLGMDFETNATVGIFAPKQRSLMVSAGKPEAIPLLFRSMLRQTAQARGEAWLLTHHPELYKDLLDGEHLLTEAAALDALADPFAPRLRERQQALKRDAGAQFPPLVILIDGMKDLLSEANSNTIGRLEVFVRLGERLSFFLVCGDSPAGMNFCRFCGSNILAASMREGPRLIAGGLLAEHQLFDTITLRPQYPAPLTADEALFLPEEGGRVLHVRLMTGNQEE